MREDKVTIQNKIESLIDDMGKSTFLKLVHFIVEVMEYDSEVKILMVRRFLDVFLEFEEIVKYLYDGEVKKKGIFVTNLSAVTLQHELADKSILVVDDIRLHGRALEEVCTFLVAQCNCKIENITLKVFADKNDTEKVQSSFQDRIQIKESVDENRWKKISSSVINSLYIMGQPYISHLPYCELKFGSEQTENIVSFAESKAEEITTEIQKYYGVHSYLYFVDDISDCQSQKKMSFVEQNLIRIYVYDRLKKVLIIPYSFLKPLSDKGILSYYEILKKFNIVNVSDELSNNEYGIRYLYSLETYVTSMNLGRKFLSDRNVTDVSWNEDIEKYSFGCSFNFQGNELSSCIAKRVPEANIEYAGYSEANLQLIQEDDISELITSIKDSNHESIPIFRFVESYIKCSGRKDEEYAKQNKKRMRGIEYLRLRQWFSNESVAEQWKTIIKIVDSGRGTLSVSSNVINQKKFVDSLLYAGEQNFACNEENLIYFIYPLLEFECFCQNNLSCNDMGDKVINKGKINRIDCILKYWPELREKVDNKEIENLKNQNILLSGKDYYMSRYPVYEKNETLQKILKMMKHYEEEQI
jgi:hypoxanthine-guanine phosphoribosyltransferase